MYLLTIVRTAASTPYGPLRPEEAVNLRRLLFVIVDAGQGPAGTMEYHGMRKGLPHILIEIRQDLIKTEEHVEFWADKISDAYQSIEDEVLLWFAKTVESNS